MNVLLINGSPHKNGCTNAALTEMAKVLNEAGIETTIFHIGSAPVGGCVGCGGYNRLPESLPLRRRSASPLPHGNPSEWL